MTASAVKSKEGAVMAGYEIPRSFFSHAFKRAALERVLLEGKAPDAVARELAMPLQVLQEWLDAEEAMHTPPLVVPLPPVGRRVGNTAPISGTSRGGAFE
ncbi:hypothetical protein WM40_13960 [Robbsia andropogonis]|uniref:Transposase n=2 Tax=Robbsia andropogonis TaxID=28092 RepID=A0A0F5JZ51_9BURK|nr:hypothetical protein WM40_13960 [Robbsia andropogonis]